jgi:hypothetical protein
VDSSSSTGQNAEGNRVAKGTIQPVVVNGAATLSCDTTQNGFTPATVCALGPWRGAGP